MNDEIHNPEPAAAPGQGATAKSLLGRFKQLSPKKQGILAACAAGAVLVLIMLASNPHHSTQAASAASTVGALIPVPKDATPVAGKDYPLALTKMMDKGGKLLGTIDVGDGLHAYLVEANGTRSLVYGSPNNEIMIVGAVIDKTGASLTAEHMKLAGLSNPGQQAAQAQGQPQVAQTTDVTDKWPDIQKASFATTGNGPKTLYAFYEPHCGYCAKLVDEVAQKNVTMKWIPVGFLSPDSDQFNAAFVHSNDGTQFLQNWMAAKAQHREQEITGKLTQVAAADAKGLKYNNDLMSRLGIEGTPAILVRDSSGKVEVVRGLPSPQQLDEIIAKLAPAQG